MTAAARANTAANERGLVVLVGGPIDPRWYYTDDLAATMRVAGDEWAYVETNEVVAHPTLDAAGTVHRRRPVVARPVVRDDPTRCTYLGCAQPPTRRLTQSTGGASWFGCDQHWPAMQKALDIGMPGATTGTAWVEVLTLSTKGPR